MSQASLAVKQSMYGSYPIAVVEAGVGVVVGFVVAKAAAIVVKVVKIVVCYAAEVAAEAVPVPVVDWQGCFDAERREYLMTGPNVVVGLCCLDHPQAGPVDSGWQPELVACLYETQRKKATENATSLLMIGKMCPVLAAVPAADFPLIDAAVGCPEHGVVGIWEAERSRFLIPSGE